jgi:hypothetical protein
MGCGASAAKSHNKAYKRSGTPTDDYVDSGDVCTEETMQLFVELDSYAKSFLTRASEAKSGKSRERPVTPPGWAASSEGRHTDEPSEFVGGAKLRWVLWKAERSASQRDTSEDDPSVIDAPREDKIKQSVMFCTAWFTTAYPTAHDLIVAYPVGERLPTFPEQAPLIDRWAEPAASDNLPADLTEDNLVEHEHMLRMHRLYGAAALA